MTDGGWQTPDGQWRRVAEHLEGSDEVVAIYLFGSQARGENDHLSDVDLAVLLQRDLLKETTWHLVSKLDVEVSDLLHTSNVDFHVLNLAPLAARFEIISTSRLLLSTDDAQRTDFEVAVMNEWWDFKNYEELLDRYLLARIKEDFCDAEREQYHGALGTAG